jgi:hypothetical protein
LSKTVAAKLLVKPGAAVWVDPPSRRGLLGGLPEGATAASSFETAGVAVLVVDDAASARAALEAHGDRLAMPPILWFLYPKGGRADINRDSLWPLVAAYGLRPITQVAVDETWSALRFRPLRPDEPPFTGGR